MCDQKGERSLPCFWGGDVYGRAHARTGSRPDSQEPGRTDRIGVDGSPAHEERREAGQVARVPCAARVAPRASRLGHGDHDPILRALRKGYRGERLADHPVELGGNNDLLSITQPEIIRDIHEAGGFALALISFVALLIAC